MAAFRKLFEVGGKSRAFHSFIMCPLCGEPVTKPRTIPCGHVFCQQCLRHYYDQMSRAPVDTRQPPPTEILCPTCCGYATLTARGIEGFSDLVSIQHPAVLLGQNVEVVKDKQAACRINARCGSGRECAGAPDKVEAYCCHCQRGFCLLCESAHRKRCGHVFIRKPTMWRMQCKHHRKEAVQTMCTDCTSNNLLCAKCAEEHAAAGGPHNTIPVAERAQQCRDKVADMDEVIVDYMKTKYDKLKQLDKLRGEYDVISKEAAEEVRREADRHIRAIHTRKTELITTLERRFSRINKAIAAYKEHVDYLLRRMADFRKMAYTLREKGHENLLLANYENVRLHSVNIDHDCKQKAERLEYITRYPKFTASQSMEIGLLADETSTLPCLTEAERDKPPQGYANLNSHSPLERPREWPALQLGPDVAGNKMKPQGLAFLSGGHLVVAEYEGKKLSIIDPEQDPTGQNPTHVTYPNNSLFPRNVVVIDEENNTVAVTDDFEKCVKVFAYDKPPKTVKPDGAHFVSPSGLAYAPKKKLFIVSDIGQQTVFIMTTKGRVRASIPKRTEWKNSTSSRGVASSSQPLPQTGGPYRLNGPEFLTVDAYERILVSDSKNNSVKVFHTDGTFEMEFGAQAPTPLGTPMGICVDRQNNILVADSTNHRVCEFNEQGQFLRNVLTQAEHEITWPWGLAISRRGVVAVSDLSKDTVRLFQVHRYIADSDGSDSEPEAH